MTTGDRIPGFQLITPPASGQGGAKGGLGPSVTFPVGTRLADAEEQLVQETLKLCDGDKERAAKMLGISSRTLYRRFSKETG